MVITVTGAELRHQRYLASIRNAHKRKERLKQRIAEKAAKKDPSLLEKVDTPAEAKLDFATMKRSFPNFAERLRKTLVISKIEPDRVAEEVTPVDGNALSFDCLVDKNNKMEEKGTATEVREYVAGSCIYYGSTITIQARHGGYMSYNDPKNLKASAHKVMQTTKFVIYKAKDPAFVGAVLYGDPVILQAGQHEVLGAQYGGGPIIANEKRKIRPALINFRRENAYKAAQYGRWIIVKRDNASQTFGQAVEHFDKVMLSQEWYYLASSSPYEASMECCGNFETALQPKPGTETDLFYPKSECAWRMVLLNVPTDLADSNRKREYLMHDASMQIVKSEENHWQSRNNLIHSLMSQLPKSLTLEAVTERTMGHKSTYHDEQANYIDLYDSMSRRNFKSNCHSVGYLERVYGKDSPVTAHARAVRDAAALLRRQQEEGYKGEVVITRTPLSEIDECANEYWEAAEKLLVDSRVYATMPSVMEKYYGNDGKTSQRRAAAAKVIQRLARKYVCRRRAIFTFARAMVKLDKTREDMYLKKLAKKKKMDGDMAAEAMAMRESKKGHTEAVRVSHLQRMASMKRMAGRAVKNLKKDAPEPVAPVQDDGVVIGDEDDPPPSSHSAVSKPPTYSSFVRARCVSFCNKNKNPSISATALSPSRSDTLPNLPIFGTNHAEESVDGAVSSPSHLSRSYSSSNDLLFRHNTLILRHQTGRSPSPGGYQKSHTSTVELSKMDEVISPLASPNVRNKSQSMVAIKEDSVHQAHQLAEVSEGDLGEPVTRKCHSTSELRSSPLPEFVRVDKGLMSSSMISLRNARPHSAVSSSVDNIHWSRRKKVDLFKTPESYKGAQDTEAMERRERRKDKKEFKEVNKLNLGKTKQNTHGLPIDVFENSFHDTNLDTTVNYLKSVYGDQSPMFEGLKLRKKRK